MLCSPTSPPPWTVHPKTPPPPPIFDIIAFGLNWTCYNIILCPGNTAILHCKYTHNFQDSLYSLKWYKDEVEFYRWDTGEVTLTLEGMLQVSAVEHQRETESIRCSGNKSWCKLNIFSEIFMFLFSSCRWANHRKLSWRKWTSGLAGSTGVRSPRQNMRSRRNTSRWQS